MFNENSKTKKTMGSIMGEKVAQLMTNEQYVKDIKFVALEFGKTLSDLSPKEVKDITTALKENLLKDIRFNSEMLSIVANSLNKGILDTPENQEKITIVNKLSIDSKPDTLSVMADLSQRSSSFKV